MPGFSEIEEKSLDWHIRNLKTLRDDLIREEDGLKIERAVDFSDIFVYMYPEKMSKVWIPTQLIRVMFNKTGYRFILLPGAAWELLMYIRRRAECQERMVEEINYRIFINNQYVKKFMEIVPKGNSREIEKAYREMEENCSFTRFLMRGGTGGWMGAPLARLSKLIRGGTLVSADRLVNLKEAGANRDIFQRVLDILNIRRSSSEYKEPNTVDAHNFATVYALNETYGRRHYFTVTTSSTIPSCAYEQVKWKNGHLHRNPINVLYYAEAEFNKTSIKEIENVIKENETIRDIRGNRTVIGETVSGYDRFLSYLKEASSVPQTQIEESLPIEAAYTLRNEDRFWNRLGSVKSQFQSEVKKAESALRDFLEPYDPWVDTYEDFAFPVPTGKIEKNTAGRLRRQRSCLKRLVMKRR